MKLNVTIILTIAGITILQRVIPISEGKTLFSYVLPYTLFITRIVGILSLFNIPIPNKFFLGSEAGILVIATIMFLLSAFRHEYQIYWLSLLILYILSGVCVGILEFVNRYYMTYETIEKVPRKRRDYDEF